MITLQNHFVNADALGHVSGVVFSFQKRDIISQNGLFNYLAQPLSLTYSITLSHSNFVVQFVVQIFPTHPKFAPHYEMMRKRQTPQTVVTQWFAAFYKKAQNAKIYSHSIVAGGFGVTSYTTRFTPSTSYTIRFDTCPSTS